MVRYADLSQDRTLDYVSSWDMLLALREIQLYLQYAVARFVFFVRLNKIVRTSLLLQLLLNLSQKKKLARKIIFFPLAVEQTTKELKPHTLCVYPYELATEFSSFYNQEKVMVEDQDTQNLRLFLCAKTQLVLEIDLEFLAFKPSRKCKENQGTIYF